jgi:predicted O-linked N-acetylglucosamine transferase (SPINDLY family)
VSTIAETFAEAKAHHRAGDLRTAEQFYRRVLQAEPANVEAHYLLGAACHGLGKTNEAIMHLSQAVRLEPNHAEAHNRLGAVLAQQSRLDEAILSFQQALRQRPGSAEISLNLRHATAVKGNSRGTALAQQGKLDEAATCFRRAIELKSDFAEAHHNLGTVLGEQAKWGDAVACHRRALELRPDFAEAYNNLGAVLVRQEKWDEAVACFQRALELNPGYFKAYNNLAAAWAKQDKLDEAVACCRRALDLQPDFAEAHNILGAVLRDQYKLDEAAACFRRALELKPDFTEAHFNLGVVYDKQDKLDEATACFRRALELQPDRAAAQMSLGIVLSDQGAFDGAAACFRRALELQPDDAEVFRHRAAMLMQLGKADEALASIWKALETKPQYAAAHSDALYTLQYQQGVTLGGLAAAHREYEERHAAPLRATWRPHENQPDPERRLRLGFVSPDFGMHPVSYFLVRVLENLDPRQVETTCYSDRVKTDAMKIRLQAASAAWRECALNDQQLADQIRADRIDIAFDLAGHTGNNRMLMFARKPAPIQINWIGYEGTTGLTAMDYLLADRYEVPESAEPYMQEQVLRMPDGCFCYDPPGAAPRVSSLPARERGYVTFGSFNNLAKMTPDVVEVWAAILRRVPGSRLVLKYRWLDTPSVTQRIAEMFVRRGIDSGRLDLLGWSPHEDMLRQYQRMDVALDPFPFNGGVTTCDALWMGVPVVTCPGETFASRHSLSHLSNVGLTETIAGDLEGYVEIAVGLANDLPRLADIRASLRQQMADSPLCDGRRFAENLQDVLRRAWRAWCAKQPAE